MAGRLAEKKTDRRRHYVSIRDFRKSDMDDLLDLLPKSFAEEFEVTGFDPDHVRHMVDQLFGVFGRIFLGLTALFGRELAKFLVADVDNRVVGTTIVNNEGSVAYISTVMVNPDYRRKGIATMLMRSAVDYISKKKMSKAALHVVSTNIPAKNMYAKLGFIEFEKITYLVGEINSLSIDRSNSGEVLTRRFQNSDVNQVCSLIEVSENPDHLRVYDFCRDNLKTPLWRRIVHFSTERKIVAIQNDRMVGYAEVRYTTPREASRIENVQVHPDHRSSGIEEALMAAAIDQIRESRGKSIRVAVPAGRQELIKMLESHGFRKHLELEGMFIEIQ